MKTKKIALTLIPAATLFCLTLTQPVSAYQSPEAQSFISGFNSFKSKDYKSAIKQFSEVMGQPESQLRELTLVFLSRSYFKEGNTDEAAWLLYLWKQEYPNSNLKTTLEQDLLRETAKSNITAILAKKEQERIAREKAEQERIAAIRAEEERKAREMAEAQRIAREKAAAEKLANHKATIYAAASTPKLLLSYPVGDLTAVAAREMTVPLTITNPGIMPDSFSLATTLPAGWKSRFELEGKQVSVTSELAPGSSTRVILALTPPVNILEGQQISVPLQLTSKVAGDRSISSEITMVASAPIVRAVVKKLDGVDGDPSRAQCLISVLNVGSADASTLNITITHPATHIPVANGSASFNKVSGDSIRIGQLNLTSGGLQEFLINFKLKDGNSAKDVITCKAELSLE
jgi:hypothetical protein